MDNTTYESFVIEEPTLAGSMICLEGLSLKHVSLRYANWFNDKDVCRDNSHGKIHNTIEMTRSYVEAVDKSKSVAAFAIVIKKDNLHIGNICLKDISWNNRFGEIAILLGDRAYWGRGIATEAYRLIIDYGFNTLDLHRLYSGMTVRNKAMIRVAQKAGMSEEGISKETLLKDGKYLDIVRYAMINPKHKKESAAA